MQSFSFANTHNDISSIKENGAEISGQELLNKFNQHFVNLSCPPSMHNDLSNVPLSNETIFLDSIEEQEVLHVFQELNNTSVDIDGMQLKPIRFALDILLPYLMHIFNLCIAHAIFPSKLQSARVSII